jgi:hypothetical protein
MSRKGQARATTAADATACAVCGRDSCENPAHASPALEPGRLEARPAHDVMNTQSASDIVEALAWPDCLTVLAAESGAGKTFLLLDLAGAVADGEPWHGRTTLQGSVLYLAYEGALALRLRALHHIARRQITHLYIVEPRDPLSPRLTREGELQSIGELAVQEALSALRARLARAGLPPLRLLLIDTVRASLSGSEDSSESVSGYLRAVRRLMAVVPGAATVLAHHAGWQDGDTPRKRERGSSAWRGNCDATLYLEAERYDADRGQAELTVTTLKTRDGEIPPPLRLLRQRVDLHERDRHGRPRTSCIIDRDPRTPDERAEAERVAREESQHSLDVRLLHLMRDKPNLTTSKEAIRDALGLGAPAVRASVARLLERGWIQPPEKQRLPYRVTDAGRQVVTDSR